VPPNPKEEAPNNTLYYIIGLILLVCIGILAFKTYKKNKANKDAQTTFDDSKDHPLLY